MNRRLLIAGIVVLLLLLAAFGGVFQASTQRALERAEAMQFRRLLVARPEDQEVFRFFFVTNRRLSEGEAELQDRFTRERDSRLTMGTFDTTIEPSLGIGMLINPTDWFQNEEIRLQDVRQLQRDEFIAELTRQVRGSTHRSLLININGFRERFPSALRKTAFLAHVLDIDSPMVVFDWPGDQGSTPQAYRRAQGLARESGADLAQTIRLMIDDVSPERLWILANSMGGEVVVTAMAQLYKNADLADAETEIEHVILTAPDVSHADFGTVFRPKIKALSDHLTVYVSSNDRALLMSRILNRQRRLGQSTMDPANPDQSEEALEALDMLEPGSDRISLIDITPVNRTRNFHNFSLETPEFFDDLFLRVINAETPQSRLRYRVRNADGTEYWVLTGGR